MFSEEEAEVDDAANDLEGEVMPVIRGGFDDVHGVGAAEVVDVEEVVPLPQHVEGEVTICLQSLPTINDLSPVSIEHRPFTLTLLETRLKSLSNSIDVLTINFGPNLEVVITVNHLLVVGREEDGAVLFPDDPEIEGRLGELKGDCCVGDGEGEVGFGVYGEDAVLWDFESFMIGVCDFEGEIEEGVGVEGEEEGLDDGTTLLYEVVISPRVAQSEHDRSGVANFLYYFVVGLGEGGGEEGEDED